MRWIIAQIIQVEFTREKEIMVHLLPEATLHRYALEHEHPENSPTLKVSHYQLDIGNHAASSSLNLLPRRFALAAMSASMARFVRMPAAYPPAYPQEPV